MTSKQFITWKRPLINPDFTFISERLILKEVTWEDLENIHQLHLHPEITEFSTLGIPDSINETAESIRLAIEDREKHYRTKIWWALFKKDSYEFIGEAGINLLASIFKCGHLYYNILPAHWGCGFATETARNVIKHAFIEIKLNKIEAGVAAENTRSIRVLEKAGMRNDGLKRKILPVKGRWIDSYHYTIEDNDYRSN